MSFQENLINKDQRLHINLSLYALNIVINDIDSFYSDIHNSDKNVSNFINRVLTNYSKNSPFNLQKTFSSEYKNFKELFKENSFFDIENKEFASFLEDISKKSALKTASESLIEDKGKGFKIRLNNNVYRNLTNFTSESLEYILFKKPGKYVKAVIESYCRLPYVLREKYFFAEIIETANAAIKLSCSLTIEQNNGNIYKIYPYSVTTNNSSDYNYIVGISESDTTGSNLCYQTVSFRISRIFNLKLNSEDTIKWSDNIRHNVEEDISKKGVQFLLNDAVDVKIRLTEEGIYKYSTQLNLRPQAYKIEEKNLYFFHTTPMQIKFYFFKFGKDAEIIFPPDLREWFHSEYAEAETLYKK